jgi:hypothetical protein
MIAGITAIPEMPEAAFDQVFGCQTADCPAVRRHSGKGRALQPVADIDSREFRGQQYVGTALVFHAGYDTVAAPLPEPRRKDLAAPVFSEVYRPRLMLPEVSPDAV